MRVDVSGWHGFCRVPAHDEEELMAGNIVHFEIPSKDTAKVKEFWGQLFGWTFDSWEGPDEYHVIRGPEPGGGIYPSKGGESGLSVYFGTDDVAATASRVEELGGSIVMPKTPIPTIGYFAICTDIEGNPFALFESDESAQAPS
jgi:predicted enzyme related to lactoylglutathione lyase